MMETSGAMEDEFTTARLYISKMKSEVKSLVSHSKQLELDLKGHAHRSLASESELSRLQLLVSQVRSEEVLLSVVINNFSVSIYQL